MTVTAVSQTIDAGEALAPLTWTADNLAEYDAITAADALLPEGADPTEPGVYTLSARNIRLTATINGSSTDVTHCYDLTVVPGTVTVRGRACNVALQAKSSICTYGCGTELLARVTDAQDAPVKAGKVSFYSGNTLLGTAAWDAQAEAYPLQLTTELLPSDKPYTIHAVFTPETGDAVRSNALSLTVEKAALQVFVYSADSACYGLESFIIVPENSQDPIWEVTDLQKVLRLTVDGTEMNPLTESAVPRSGGLAVYLARLGQVTLTASLNSEYSDRYILEPASSMCNLLQRPLTVGPAAVTIPVGGTPSHSCHIGADSYMPAGHTLIVSGYEIVGQTLPAEQLPEGSYELKIAENSATIRNANGVDVTECFSIVRAVSLLQVTDAAYTVTLAIDPATVEFGETVIMTAAITAPDGTQVTSGAVQLVLTGGYELDSVQIDPATGLATYEFPAEMEARDSAYEFTAVYDAEVNGRQWQFASKPASLIITPPSLVGKITLEAAPAGMYSGYTPVFRIAATNPEDRIWQDMSLPMLVSGVLQLKMTSGSTTLSGWDLLRSPNMVVEQTELFLLPIGPGEQKLQLSMSEEYAQYLLFEDMEASTSIMPHPLTFDGLETICAAEPDPMQLIAITGGSLAEGDDVQRVDMNLPAAFDLDVPGKYPFTPSGAIVETTLGGTQIPVTSFYDITYLPGELTVLPAFEATLAITPETAEPLDSIRAAITVIRPLDGTPATGADGAVTLYLTGADGSVQPLTASWDDQAGAFLCTVQAGAYTENGPYTAAAHFTPAGDTKVFVSNEATLTVSKYLLSDLLTATAAEGLIYSGQESPLFTLAATQKGLTLWNETNPMNQDLTLTVTDAKGNTLTAEDVTAAFDPAAQTITLAITDAGEYTLDIGLNAQNQTERRITADLDPVPAAIGRRALSIAPDGLDLLTGDPAPAYTYTFSSGSLAAGHSAAITCAADGTVDMSIPGAYTIRVTGVSIRDAQGNDVTANYDIRKATATMTVAIPYTVQAAIGLNEMTTLTENTLTAKTFDRKGNQGDWGEVSLLVDGETVGTLSAADAPGSYRTLLTGLSALLPREAPYTLVVRLTPTIPANAPYYDSVPMQLRVSKGAFGPLVTVQAPSDRVYDGLASDFIIAAQRPESPADNDFDPAAMLDFQLGDAAITPVWSADGQSATVSVTDIETHSLTATLKEELQKFYTMPPVTASFTISPRPLTIIADDVRILAGETPIYTYRLAEEDSLMPGHVLTVNYELQSGADITVPGSYAIHAKAASLDDGAASCLDKYDVTSRPGILTVIDPASVYTASLSADSTALTYPEKATVTADILNRKDERVTAGSVQFYLNGQPSGDPVRWNSESGFAFTPELTSPGSWRITAEYLPEVGDVTPAEPITLTLTALDLNGLVTLTAPADAEYDGAAHAFTLAVTDESAAIWQVHTLESLLALSGGQAEWAQDGLSATIAFKDAGAWTVTAALADDRNGLLTMTDLSASCQISPRSLALAPAAAEWVTGDTPPAMTFTATGSLADGDTLHASFTLATGEAIDAALPEGFYTLTIAAASVTGAGGDVTANYRLDLSAEAEIIVHGRPTFIITIPAEAAIDGDPGSGTLRLTASDVANLRGAEVVLTVDSAQGFRLAAPSGDIPYTLAYPAQGTQNEAVQVAFTADGTAELTLTAEDGKYLMGTYTDTLTFTVELHGQ